MDERPTILFVIPGLTGGGAERVITTLLGAFDPRRARTLLAAVDLRGAVFRNRVPAHTEVVDLAVRRVRYALWPLTRLIRRRRPQVVVSTLDHLNIGLALTCWLWPAEVRLALRATHLMYLDQPFMRRVLQLALPRADLLIFQSAEMEAAYRAALDLRRVRSVVINNPASIAEIRAAALEPLAPAFPPGAPHLVAAGRLSPEKGVDLLIEALRLCRNRTVTLTLLGDGPERERLEAQTRAAGLEARVRFHGFEPNPFRHFAHATALVLPSRSEGFPNVVLEALACGAPVVATPVPGVPALLEATPGCEVASEISAPALAEALDRLLARAPVRVGPEAVASFEADVIAERYLDAILEGSGSGRCKARSRPALTRPEMEPTLRENTPASIAP